MPQIGERKRGSEIGYKDESHTFVWLACPDCGRLRWILLKNGGPQRLMCKHCARFGQRSEHWAGGRNAHGQYVRLRLHESDFFYSMADPRGRVFEHRLIMAKHLGRCLQPWEVVHHKNGVGDDNRIANLALTMNGIHVSEHRRVDIRNGIDPFHGHGFRRKYLGGEL